MQRFSRATDTPVMETHHWAVETIRKSSGLGDLSIAIRRQLPYGNPDKLFNIYVQDGIVRVATRNYPDYIEKKWTDEFTVGNGIAVAIAFNGTWQLYRNKWRFVSDEYPYLFWVNSSKDLYVQMWRDSETRIKFATDVVKVSALRGWKSTNGVLTDQGVICAYIKTDGKVYYRNFCEQLDGSFTWELEREVTQITPPVSHIGLFLTNDYRIGFICEKADGNIQWLISARSWSAMASPHENIPLGLTNFKVSVYPVANKKANEVENISVGVNDFYIGCTTPIYPTIVNVFNEVPDVTHVKVSFSHPIAESLSGKQGSFLLKDYNNVEFAVLSTDQGKDKTEIVLTVANYSSAKNPMRLIYNDGVGADNAIPTLTVLKDNVYFAIPKTDFTFVANIEPPKGYQYENITLGITNYNVVVTKVYYKYIQEHENISVGVTNYTITVTKVGANPL